MRKLPPNVIDCSILWERSRPARSQALNGLAEGASRAQAEKASWAVAADSRPDATVVLNGCSVAAGTGYAWGHGDLTFTDRTYKLSIFGISIIDAGAASIIATGNVYNLNKLSDLEGTYAAATSIAGGRSAAYLRNEHGVVINLSATPVGRRLSLSGDSVEVTLKS